MNDEQNGNGKARLDRLEGMMELVIADHVKFSDEHNKLLTSQILLTDRMDKLTGTMQELADSQKHTDENMGVLIQMMDEFIRNQKERRS
jgi:hypothetical protein